MTIRYPYEKKKLDPYFILNGIGKCKVAKYKINIRSYLYNLRGGNFFFNKTLLTTKEKN